MPVNVFKLLSQIAQPFAEQARSEEFGPDYKLRAEQLRHHTAITGSEARARDRADRALTIRAQEMFPDLGAEDATANYLATLDTEELNSARRRGFLDEARLSQSLELGGESLRQARDAFTAPELRQQHLDDVEAERNARSEEARLAREARLEQERIRQQATSTRATQPRPSSINQLRVLEMIREVAENVALATGDGLLLEQLPPEQQQQILAQAEEQVMGQLGRLGSFTSPAVPQTGRQMQTDELPDPSNLPDGTTATDSETGQVYTVVNGEWQ